MLRRSSAEAAATDRQVVETLGGALAGSGKAWESTHPGLLGDLAHGEFFQFFQGAR